MTRDFGLDIQDVDLGDAQLDGLEVRQWLCRPFEAEARIKTPQHALELRGLVGQDATIAMPHDDTPRLHGVVRRVRRVVAEATGTSIYDVLVVPHFWLTTRRRAHRIFRDSSVIDITRTILSEYGSSMPAPRVTLSESHPKRDYVAQYDESDHDFLLRLLAEEGIVAFWDPLHESALSLIDDTTSLSPRIESPIRFIPASLERPGDARHVFDVESVAEVTSGRVALRDYDYQRPDFDLAGEGRADPGFSRELDLESYAFEVGHFGDGDGGALAALRRLEAERASGQVVHCSGNTAISPGTRFTLVDAPRDDQNGEYVVTESTTVFSRGRGDSPSGDAGARHAHRWTCMPAAKRFRPKRLPKPRIAGAQTAVVVGMPGEEINVDELGRVEVEFHWDRRDLHMVGASRRVRVSQAWAGGDYGLTCIPRIGDEVVVTFLDGDPDEPLVVGRVHNPLTPGPLKLPDQKTRSIWQSRSTPGGGGHNWISMEDQAGEELLDFRAQRDFRSEALRNADTIVGVDQSAKVGGSSKTQVAGPYSLQSASTSIGTGPYSLTGTTIEAKASEDMTLKAGGEREDASANHHVNTGGLWIKASSVVQMVTPHFHVFSDDIVLKAGGSLIKLTPGSIEITSPGDISIQSGGNVTVNGSLVKLNC